MTTHIIILLRLKWSNIDFQTGAIRSQRKVQRLDGKVQETKLKTNNSYRTILVDQDILKMLVTMKEERKIESDYVFSSPTGGILEPGSQRKRRIPADGYVKNHRTVKYHTICRNITIGRNKFPVLFSSGNSGEKKT